MGQTDRHGDRQTDIGIYMGKDIGTNIGTDRQDMGTDRQDMGIDIGTDMRPDTQTDIGKDMGTNIGTVFLKNRRTCGHVRRFNTNVRRFRAKRRTICRTYCPTVIM